MEKLLMVLAAGGLVAALATLVTPTWPGDPAKDWVWKTDGKRWTRTEEVVKPFVMPATTVVDVPDGEGDSWRMRYTGKRLERIATREVPRPAPEPGHVCSWRSRYEGKRTWREKVCVVDGVVRPTAEMHPS